MWPQQSQQQQTQIGSNSLPSAEQLFAVNQRLYQQVSAQEETIFLLRASIAAVEAETKYAADKTVNMLQKELNFKTTMFRDALKKRLLVTEASAATHPTFTNPNPVLSNEKSNTASTTANSNSTISGNTVRTYPYLGLSSACEDLDGIFLIMLAGTTHLFRALAVSLSKFNIIALEMHQAKYFNVDTNNIGILGRSSNDGSTTERHTPANTHIHSTPSDVNSSGKLPTCHPAAPLAQRVFAELEQLSIVASSISSADSRGGKTAHRYRSLYHQVYSALDSLTRLSTTLVESTGRDQQSQLYTQHYTLATLSKINSVNATKRHKISWTRKKAGPILSQATTRSSGITSPAAASLHLLVCLLESLSPRCMLWWIHSQPSQQQQHNLNLSTSMVFPISTMPQHLSSADSRRSVDTHSALLTRFNAAAADDKQDMNTSQKVGRPTSTRIDSGSECENNTTVTKMSSPFFRWHQLRAPESDRDSIVRVNAVEPTAPTHVTPTKAPTTTNTGELKDNKASDYITANSSLLSYVDISEQSFTQMLGRQNLLQRLLALVGLTIANTALPVALDNIEELKELRRLSARLLVILFTGSHGVSLAHSASDIISLLTQEELCNGIENRSDARPCKTSRCTSPFANLVESPASVVPRQSGVRAPLLELILDLYSSAASSELLRRESDLTLAVELIYLLKSTVSDIRVFELFSACCGAQLILGDSTDTDFNGISSLHSRRIQCQNLHFQANEFDKSLSMSLDRSTTLLGVPSSHPTTLSCFCGSLLEATYINLKSVYGNSKNNVAVHIEITRFFVYILSTYRSRGLMTFLGLSPFTSQNVTALSTDPAIFHLRAYQDQLDPKISSWLIRSWIWSSHALNKYPEQSRSAVEGMELQSVAERVRLLTQTLDLVASLLDRDGWSMFLGNSAAAVHTHLDSWAIGHRHNALRRCDDYCHWIESGGVPSPGMDV